MQRMEQGMSKTVDLSALPESCISNILSFTSPRDACRSAAVSSVFRSAAESNTVWDRFLPSDYQEILSRAISPPPASILSSKKAFYFHLCDHPLLIDDGKKSFRLDRCSGKKCFMLGARELSIIWGDTPEYWSWDSYPESRFQEVAELLNVCWLEIRGKVETRVLSPRTTYAAYLVFKLAEERQGLGLVPAEVFVSFIGDGVGEVENHNVYLDEYWPSYDPWYPFLSPTVLPPPASLRQPEGQSPREREDGWMEIEMGEFFNDQGDDGEVQMCLMEVKGGHWKSGLIVEGIELRPKQSN
ncbi:PREDICTED: putative F-box protein PP2-B12 [Nelumbo nucifera]|uniref:F-box protein PP2-B12 n=1 Tax=Nelumbo nucifera TaxID=4432 RepID=A0A1U8A9I4_NELNU|nr:PREDICTED: putative F-box protein PP2-B12 [Nelumbo nucifera]